ncbi:hypothetical protein GZ77_00515 [Endozoicomonas montiporae]|uniref:Uncharacterized protein n=2 Tax=Endozoicomonas montiporae TaxID=1027273 RepID=A0A081N9T9_9GAMM|nr:hypothetical protein [Endozoicomonas montiporae]AMO57130.1 hypothetical protein EZMO1_3122 [Endozoicomonas montiporae CL-33]KEQ15212.1 hypothetical protein GZ77_00515 [Endozoicomonas montiporae]
MQKQTQSRWFAGVITGLLIFLTFLSVWFLLPGRLAHHFLDRLSRESGVKILPVRVDYSLFSGELLLKDTDLFLAPGLQISADEVHVHIPLSQLGSANTLQLTRLYFESPFISVDLERLGSAAQAELSPLREYLMTAVKSFELGKGGLYLSRSGIQPVAASLAYQSMQVLTDNDGDLRLDVDGLLNKGDWAFNGLFNLNSGELNGELDIRSVPLETIRGVFPGERFEQWEQVTVSASQSFFWSPDTGSHLEGTAVLSQGSMSFSDTQKIRWEELELLGFSLSDEQVSVVKGSLNDADVLLNQQALGSLPGLLSPFSQLELKRLNLFTQPSQWSDKNGKAELSHLNGQLGFTNESAVTLKATALASRGVPVALDAMVNADGQGSARFGLKKIDLAKLPPSGRTVAGYDLSGSQANASLQLVWGAGMGEKMAKGRLTFTRFQAKPGSTSASDWNLSLIRAAMTDNKGRIVVSLPQRKLADEPLTSALVRRFKESINSSFKRVTNEPYQYLNRLSGSEEPLTEEIGYKPGRALLCDESEQTVNQWTNILNRRPALDLSFQGLASLKDDRKGLARAELNADLLELYAVVSKKPANNNESDKKAPDTVRSIPLQTRQRLVEQMYLRIHNRRLPDIGDETQQQRVAKAENWLVNNWPLKPESLQTLAEERAETIKNCLMEAGVDSNRLHIEPARVVDGQAQMHLKLLY